MRDKNFIYGRNPILESLRDGVGFEQIVVQRGINREVVSEIRSLARALHTPVQLAPAPRLARITRKNHQGVIAFRKWVEYSDVEAVVADAFEQGVVPQVLVLDRITDVRNLGAIARSAEVLGATAILLPMRESAMLNEDAVKTSAGAITRIPVGRVPNLASTCSLLRQMGLTLLCAAQEATIQLDQTDLTGPCAVILGSERNGVVIALRRVCDQSFSIPQTGRTESLNVSVAAGIILYESLRQRKQ